MPLLGTRQQIPADPAAPRGRAHATRQRALPLALVAAVVGAAVHDSVEFGRPAVANTGIVLVAGGLALWTITSGGRRRRAVGAVVLVALATTILFGGAIASVLPLAIWPWRPEQSVSHYAIHTLWAVATLPLLLVSLRAPRSLRRAQHLPARRPRPMSQGRPWQ